ncbi:zinc-binding domain-containing protein [Aspergillus granulosus]|uniref:Zinc-binding domain-containing protein n=1 Tax=Aspergillus granulosus TaxID=176169 RepID=A0ABR4H470_9EURO
MPSHRKSSQKTNSMFPSLHTTVATLLESSAPELKFTFHPDNTDNDCAKAYNTNIMGKFICHKPGCHSVWTSKKIAIRIRLYHGETYNALVYHQRCKKCHWVSKPKLDEECYAERIVYRLKKWSGIQGLEIPAYNGGNGEGPHIERLCEGCKAGHCTQSSGDWE